MNPDPAVARAGGPTWRVPFGAASGTPIPRSNRRARPHGRLRAARGLPVAAVAALLTIAPAAAQNQPPPAQQQQQLQAEQRELRDRLARVKRELAKTEISRSAAAEGLAEAEQAISAANRRLRELAAARQAVQAQLAALHQRSRATAAAQSDEERRLGALLRAQLALAQATPWQRLIDGGNPHALGRDRVYLEWLARNRAQTIVALQDRGAELAASAAERRERQAELAAIARDEGASRAQLLEQQAARRRALDRLARQSADQRQSLAALARDDRRLAAVLDEIAKVLAEQTRREAQRQAQRRTELARRQATAGQSAKAAGSSARAEAAPPPSPAEPPAPTSAPSAKLQLPVSGAVVARFGNPRRTDAGVDAPAWKGVLIRAPEGAEVRAAAAGRVVYADWLRGYGNLLVLDHGDGVLTIYGNNQALFVGTGDRVAAGAAVAAVGASGGGAEPGLYFEVRVQGRPVDPLRWAAAR